VISYINLVHTNQAHTNNRFQSIYFDFSVLEGDRLGVKELTCSIFRAANITDYILPELDAQQPARWNIELAKYISERLSDAAVNGKLWFLIFDGFNHDSVPTQTIELIQLLSAVATGDQPVSGYNDCFRIVLLGFDDPINGSPQRIKKEPIEPITKDDLITYFRRYCEFKEINPDSEMLTLLADKVLEKDPGPGPGRQQELAKWSLVIAEKL